MEAKTQKLFPVKLKTGIKRTFFGDFDKILSILLLKMMVFGEYKNE